MCVREVERIDECFNSVETTFPNAEVAENMTSGAVLDCEPRVAEEKREFWLSTRIAFSDEGHADQLPAPPSLL